jgi:hypothetical protein
MTDHARQRIDAQANAADLRRRLAVVVAKRRARRAARRREGLYWLAVVAAAYLACGAILWRLYPV